MHEIGLAGGILRMVEAAAERDRFTRVAQLRIEVGALAGVEPRALQFALTAITPGTCLEGGEIAINEIPGTARCRQCEAVVQISSHLDACSQCGAYTLVATGGTELRVVDLVVFDQ